MSLICPGCGKPGKGVCTRCYLQRNPLTLKPFTHVFCDCGRCLYQGQWIDNNAKCVFMQIKNNIQTPLDVRINHLKVEEEVDKGTLKLRVQVKGLYRGEKFRETYVWQVPAEKKSCKICSRKSQGYYEAVLQVREDVIPQISETQLTKTMKVRGGLDYYLASKDYAFEVARQLRKRGYNIIHTTKQAGVKEGKKIFRHYFSVKKKVD
ncbi:MAG: hypothetical protein GF334_07240 [Candidatus Altiarchaeales archaeon]|nr:hypothetical protein [Candidatus Altiarchaeales archaeon]